MEAALCGQRRRRVVLVPYPFQGHLTPMLQLGSILHSKGFSVIVAHTELNSPNPSNYPDFTFLHLSDNLSGWDTSLNNLFNVLHAINVNCEASFHEHMVRLLEEEEGLACIIYDTLMKFVDTVATRLNIPTALLRNTPAAHMRSYFIMFRLMEEKVLPGLPESRLHDVIPEADPLTFKNLPLPPTLSEFPKEILDFQRSYMDIRSSRAVIWNTVDMLDHVPLQQLQHQYWKVPFFSIGPINKMAPEILRTTSVMEEDNSCLSWLDKQVPNSVVFVSLGSVAEIENKELLEMAWGLAKSEQPFLWVVRPSLVVNGSLDASNCLPRDFFEKIGERGYIVKWAPQTKVLAHPAVGGFLTHCGWNSIMESMSEGVPMICRPCFTDQPLNVKYVTYVWKIGLELEQGVEGGIQRAIKKLMVSEEGKEIRQTALHMKQELENSIKPGGSSCESLNEMVEFIKSLGRNN